MYDERVQYFWIDDNGNTCLERTTNEQRFEISFGKCNREVDRFNVEIDNTALDIYNRVDKPLAVLTTSGLDSEVVVRSFHKLGIPFTGIIFKYPDRMNELDVKFGSKLLSGLNIPYEIIDFDIISFFDDELWKIAHTRNIHSPHICVEIKMFEMLCSTFAPILCAGDITLERKNIFTRNFYSVEEEQYMAVEQYLRQNSYEGIPRFYKFNPEIMLSFLTEPLVKKWIQLANPMRMTRITEFKPFIFDSLWPGIRPRVKLDGYEYFVGRFERTAEKLSNELPLKNDMHRFTYDSLLSSLSPEH